MSLVILIIDICEERTLRFKAINNASLIEHITSVGPYTKTETVSNLTNS